MLYALHYTESHPDRETRFLGVFSTEEKAETARREHMSSEKASLPRASISEWNYTICETELDGWCEQRV